MPVDEASGQSPCTGGRKELTVVFGTERCTLLLYPGAEPAALHQTLAARFQLLQQPFYLTEENGTALVPLTSALPDGLMLTVHLVLEQKALVAEARTQCAELREQHTSVADSGAQRAEASEPQLPTKGVLWKDSSLISEHSYAPSASSQASLDSPLLRNARSGPMSSQPCQTYDVSTPRTDSTQMAILEQEHGHAGGEPRPRRASFGMGRRRSGDQASFLSAGRSAEPASFRSNRSVEETVEALEQSVERVDRFQRLSADLANERTLLAWHRTTLAGIRTTFSFLAVTSQAPFWQFSVLSTNAFCALMVVVSAVLGTLHYGRIKQVLLTPTPPQGFGRQSTNYISVLVVFTSLAVALGIWTQQWKKG